MNAALRSRGRDSVAGFFVGLPLTIHVHWPSDSVHQVHEPPRARRQPGEWGSTAFSEVTPFHCLRWQTTRRVTQHELGVSGCAQLRALHCWCPMQMPRSPDAR